MIDDNCKTKWDKAKQLVTLAKQYKRLMVKPDPYNLFSVLRGKSDEVRLHSRFLSDLLNPHGLHNLKYSPLISFFDSLLDIKIVSDNYDFEVKVEHENIDIYLVNQTTKQAVIIENKIYADDQEQQLLRYFYTAKEEGYEDITIVYLTLNGDQPSTLSINGELGSLNVEDIKLLSYQFHIQTWITSLIEKSAEHPSLRESLIQYISIIRELTGMSNNKEYINELKKLIIDIDCVDMVNNLQEANAELEQDAQVFLWQSLLNKAKNEFGILTEGSMKSESDVMRFFSRSGVSELYVSYSLEDFEHCSLRVQIENGENIFIGVLNDPEHKNEDLRKLLPLTGYRCNDYLWWPVFKYVEYDGCWGKKLDSDQVKKLHDKFYVDKLTDHIVSEMKLLKSKLYIKE